MSVKKLGAVLVVGVLCAGVVSCTSDDTVQESVDGGYFPSDATAYDSTVASEDGGGEGDATPGPDASDAGGGSDAGHDATVDANGVDANGGDGGTDAAGDTGTDGAAVDAGEDAAG